MAEEAPKPVGRPMRFPYTWSAKIAQFPLKWYVNSNPLWKYYFLGVIVALPVFYKVDRLSNSPGNVAKWAESKRKEAEEHHH
ncbi:unnamed protein product [Chironomus riparius]|uniref:Uncharacterized protein n=1 Tax=Chironomus riparius TaxID=315576 RepID=A0A9N9WWW4_9DIPT|nr:unnamed protein product [Chironomus riparius]